MIQAEKAQYPIGLLCRVLDVSRSGFYAWHKRLPSTRAQRDRELAGAIRVAYQTSRKTYGSPRIHAELRAHGTRCSRKRVERLMRQESLRVHPRPRYCKTTDSNHDQPVFPNQLDRKFTVDTPNQVWVGDITYIATQTGWLYLAIVIDLYSRMIVGWAMSTRIDAQLILDA